MCYLKISPFVQRTTVQQDTLKQNYFCKYFRLMRASPK